MCFSRTLITAESPEKAPPTAEQLLLLKNILQNPPNNEQQQPPSYTTTSNSSSNSSSSHSSDLANYPQIPREHLILQEHLDSGTYGSVFKGIWMRQTSAGTKSSKKRPLRVALKKVFLLEKEVEILSQIRHRNIIQFYGVSQANPDFYIVTEYAENGSLYGQLHNEGSTTQQISLEQTIKWAKQIARGIAYLHYEAPITVIHRDLKSKNIVIGHKLQCKLCDFGTSKDLSHSWTAPTWGGTAAWMSPEMIGQREGITTATDVWSFGVVLWEMFSRQVPYQGLTEFKIYSIISEHGARLVIPESCPEALAKLLGNCWNSNAKQRPDIRTVLASLKEMAQDKELHEECAQLLCDKGKEEWRQRSQQQLEELDVLKLDLARQMEDLSFREEALKKRESSHRNFLHMADILNVKDVREWNEDCVCEWVQNIAAAAVGDFPDKCVDMIITCVLQNGINGQRLLKITENDLNTMGIELVALRRYIIHKLEELQESCNIQFHNSPLCLSSNSTSIADDSSSYTSSSNEKLIGCQLLLHVGLYMQTMGSAVDRFKVFLDSDWEEMKHKKKRIRAPPEDLSDSSTVIKEVNISICAVDGSSLIGPVQCICPPFGHLEWAKISREQRNAKVPLVISMHIIYTDQVIHPRSTRIQIKLDELAGGPRTLCSKRVPLKMWSIATDTSLSRISSILHRNSSMLEPKSPSATFQRRCRSFGLNGTISPSIKSEEGMVADGRGISLLNYSPIWADLATGFRSSSGSFSSFRNSTSSEEEDKK